MRSALFFFKKTGLESKLKHMGLVFQSNVFGSSFQTDILLIL
jgi:hypothetical protein